MNVIHEGEEYCLNDDNGNYYNLKKNIDDTKSRSSTPKKVYDNVNFDDSNGNKVNVVALLQSFCHTSVRENWLKNYDIVGQRCGNNVNGINKNNNCNCFLHLLLLQVILLFCVCCLKFLG